jgi:hypothetical protein
MRRFLIQVALVVLWLPLRSPMPTTSHSVIRTAILASLCHQYLRFIFRQRHWTILKLRLLIITMMTEMNLCCNWGFTAPNTRQLMDLPNCFYLRVDHSGPNGPCGGTCGTYLIFNDFLINDLTPGGWFFIDGTHTGTFLWRRPSRHARYYARCIDCA